MGNLLEQCVVVLHWPREVVNIGGVVRGMKNMGFGRLRLVKPVPFTPYVLTGLAHRSDSLVAAIEVFDTLDAALADTTFVVGTTARSRGNHILHTDVRALAPVLLSRAAQGTLALLFGPEDKGLDNDCLDRCDLIVTLPADPEYPSLNLAQAALLMLYELRMATAAPRPQSENTTPATAQQREALFTQIEQALRSVEFFKGSRDSSIMRALRRLVRRAEPDQRETALLTAIAYEVMHYVRRAGIAPDTDASIDQK